MNEYYAKFCTYMSHWCYSDNFHKDSMRPDGLNPNCKDCRSRRDGRTKRKIYRGAINDGYKICRMCEVEKPKSEFYSNKSEKDGFQLYCSDCTKSYTDKRSGYRMHKPSLLKEFGPVCQICKNRFPEDKLCVDHIFPISRLDEFFGDIDSIYNCQLACFPCNSKKGNKIINLSGWDNEI